MPLKVLLVARLLPDEHCGRIARPFSKDSARRPSIQLAGLASLHGPGERGSARVRGKKLCAGG